MAADGGGVLESVRRVPELKSRTNTKQDQEDVKPLEESFDAYKAQRDSLGH